MAEQTYDLTQQGAEVQAIINDANNCKGAGAQTTLTTESILLKDVNGQYHKILKSSFTEAIRDTLAGLLVNNDKGTTINQIAAIASGDFGSVTPANLASVLGVVPSEGYAQTDFNNYHQLGLHCYAINKADGAINNDVSGFNNWGLFYTVGTMTNTGTSIGIQYRTDSSGNVAMRTWYEVTDDTYTWGNWQTTLSYLQPYSDLPSLASALGACNGTTETDFDNIPPISGGYFIANTTTKQHAPFEDSEARGLLEVFVNISGYIVQRYTESNAVTYRNSTWLRSRNAGVWSSWQRIDNYGTTSLSGLASALGVPSRGLNVQIGSSWTDPLANSYGIWRIGHPNKGYCIISVDNNSPYWHKLAGDDSCLTGVTITVDSSTKKITMAVESSDNREIRYISCP